MKKTDLSEINREKFFAGLRFQAGNEIGKYVPKISQKPEFLFRRTNHTVKLETGVSISLASITDHSFSFLFSFFGQKNLVTVFFSELVFIPELEEPTDNPDDLPGSVNELK